MVRIIYKHIFYKVYKYEHNWDMKGYVNFTLAVSPREGWLDQNKSECR